MSPKFIVLAIVLSLAVSALATFGHGGDRGCSNKRLSKERVVEWHDKLYSTLNVLGAPGGGASGLRAWAMMTLAMFDAANLADDEKYDTYLSYSSIPSSINYQHADPLAAAAKAAQVVLDGLIPASTPAATKTMLQFAHLSQFHTQLGYLPQNSRTNNGVALGEYVGQRMLANRTGDGHPPNNCNNWPNPPTAACPNSVTNATVWYLYQYGLTYHPGQPNSPGYPQVLPFAIPSYSFFNVPPQPAPGTPQHLADFTELFAYGTSDVSRSARTSATDDIARFHDGNFASQVGWAMDFLSTSSVSMEGVDLLRACALAAVSSHDAHANHWRYKYIHYNARPIAAYRQVPDTDASLGQFRDTAWASTLTTSQTPEYPSGHSSRSGGAAFAFIKSFGNSRNFRTISYSQPGAPARTYTSIYSFLQEIHNSRIYGGVHWRTATVAGENLARQVTDYVFDNILKEN